MKIQLLRQKELELSTLSLLDFLDQVNSPFHMAAFFAYANISLASAGFSYSIIKNAMYADPLVPYLPELILTQGVVFRLSNENAKMSFAIS